MEGGPMFPLVMSRLQATTPTYYLVMQFDFRIHVDVEWMTATACVKHLFKYVHKGEDYAKARIRGITDEIELYS